MLWWAARPSQGAMPAPLLLEKMLTTPARMVHVTDSRVMIRTADGSRLEMFREEVPAAQWALLRRSSLNADGDDQPATGRSTSI